VCQLGRPAFRQPSDLNKDRAANRHRFQKAKRGEWKGVSGFLGQHRQSGPRWEEKESAGAEDRKLNTTDVRLRLDRSQDEGEHNPKGDGSREGKSEQVEMHLSDDARR
jgi:hypothetical protein